MSPRAWPLLVLLAGCPTPVSLECLPCAGDEECAPQGLTCQEQRCVTAGSVCEGGLPVLPALPASAVLFRDAFEQDDLLIAGGGRWDAVVGSDAGQTLELSTLSRAAKSMVLEDGDSANGDAGLSLVRTVNRAQGDLYFRSWVWVDRLSDAGTLGALTIRGDRGSPLAELLVDDRARVRCGSRTGQSDPCGSAAWGGPGWHQVDLAMEGVGADAGSCSLRMDGQTICQQLRDWQGVSLLQLAAGAVTMDPAWRGELRLDNLALTSGTPAPSRLALATPATLPAGSCVPVRLEFRDNYRGALARLVRQSRLVLDAGPASFHQPPGCDGPAITQIVIDAGVASWTFALRTPDAGGSTPVSVIDKAADLDPAATTWTFGPPP